jgi:cytochrome c biogenesis protein CcdA
VLFCAAAAVGAGALRADENAIDPQVAAVYADIGILLAAGAAPAAMSVFVGATAAASLLGNRFIPWQLDWVSALVAVALIILPINFISVLVFFAWCLFIAVLMLMGRLRFEEPALG